MAKPTPPNSLTAGERNALVTGYLIEYGHPVNLFRHYHPAVAREAERAVSYDDLKAACLLGLVVAARLFDAGLSPDFSAYALSRVRNEVKKLLYSHRRDRKWLGTSQVFSGSPVEGGLGAFDDVPGREEDPSHLHRRRCLVVAVRKAVGRLPNAVHQRVVTRRWGLDGGESATRQELAAEMGCSKEWLRQLENEAKRRLSTTLADEWYD